MKGEDVAVKTIDKGASIATDIWYFLWESQLLSNYLNQRDLFRLSSCSRSFYFGFHHQKEEKTGIKRNLSCPVIINIKTNLCLKDESLYRLIWLKNKPENGITSQLKHLSDNSQKFIDNLVNSLVNELEYDRNILISSNNRLSGFVEDKLGKFLMAMWTKNNNHSGIMKYKCKSLQ